ncbi:MAG TPA: ATP-binding cassette domain-containing protein [Candidatus Sulfotelmatobacter sp.]|nr:ATP-binding cassette domain-containing protein [Candidatus Sulfotelmatobacter sp.]
MHFERHSVVRQVDRAGNGRVLRTALWGRRRRAAARIQELFSRLEMGGFENRRCDKLSTGMKQKVSIVRTLVHDPQVMIFDEPTLGLDVMTARTIVQFIRDCRQNGKTVIFSTHVMSEAEKLCDRIGIIHSGRLRAEGTLEQLRAQFQATDLEEVFIRSVEVNA